MEPHHCRRVAICIYNIADRMAVRLERRWCPDVAHIHHKAHNVLKLFPFHHRPRPKDLEHRYLRPHVACSLATHTYMQRVQTTPPSSHLASRLLTSAFIQMPDIPAADRGARELGCCKCEDSCLCTLQTRHRPI